MLERQVTIISIQAMRPAVLLCSAGGQVTAEARCVHGIEKYTGEVVYAAKRDGVECILGDAGRLKSKVTAVHIDFAGHPTAAITAW